MTHELPLSGSKKVIGLGLEVWTVAHAAAQGGYLVDADSKSNSPNDTDSLNKH